MPANKFSISLPSGLTAELEALALKDGVSRSFVIREAAANYVADRKSRDEASHRSVSITGALAGFDEVARSWGDDPRQGVDYLAELRAEPGETAAEDDPCDD